MSEAITVYDIGNPGLPRSVDREAFYAEQFTLFQKGKRPTQMVEVVHVLLFQQDGSILIQQRSSKKAQNPNLLDKSIGGHIQYGDQPDYTVMVETVQELQVPSITLKTKNDFLKTYVLLQDYLNTVAVVRYIDTFDIKLHRLIDGVPVRIANRVHLFFGAYTGAIKNVDKEAKGIIFYGLEDLIKEIEQFPDRFTEDLRYLLRERVDDMRMFSKDLKLDPTLTLLE